MPTLMPTGKQQYFYTGTSKPLAGGSIFTYVAGTNTPKPAYQDPGGTTPWANPIPLDSTGSALIYWTGSYKVVVVDANGNTIYTVDNYNTDPYGFLSLFTSAGATLMGFIQNVAGAVQQKVSDVLYDLLGFKSFGLVGDGVTGNSTAINAMLANLGTGTYELLVSKGDFLLDTSVSIPANIKLRFRAGGRLMIPNGVTLTLNDPELLAGQQQIFSCTGTGVVIGVVKNSRIYPEWWGAKADGIHPNVGTDFSDRAAAAARNGPALQAALTFAGYNYAVNGITGTVELAYGGYASDRELSVPLSTNVVGAGVGCGIYLYAATGNCLSLNGTNNSLVSDIFLAPLPGPTWNYSSGYGLYVKNVSTPCIRNVWSSSFGAGTFYFENTIEARIHGLISDNSNGPAFSIRGVGQGSVLSNCVTAGTQNGACFDIQSGYDWHLIGCTAKDGTAGTNGYYLNACENINLTACGCHMINKEGFLITSSALNCNLTGCFVNDASTITGGAGLYAGFNVSGNRIKLTAPKVTSSQVGGASYNYGIILGGAAIDCTVADENISTGTLGFILDAQPIGANTNPVRKVTTTSATPLTIWTKSLNNSAGARVEAIVVGKQRGDTGVTAMFKVSAYVRTNSTSTAFLNGPTALESYKSDPSLNATFVLTSTAANAGVVALQVTGMATGNPMDWEATASSISVTG